jgi:hypothetical protein
MPDSLTIQLINGVWDSISQAVTDGLARGGQKNLSDFMPIDQEKLTVPGWQDSAAFSLGGGISQVRLAVCSQTTMDFIHRYHLDYDALRAPQLSAITAWAARARLLELRRVAEHLVSVAERHRRTPADLGSVTVDSWGQLRCVTFTPAPGSIPWPDLPSIGWDGPVSIDMPSPAEDLQGLVFPVGGGPYVRRPDDLTLSWLPAGDIGADLVLTEQLEIVNALPTTDKLPATVAGVLLTPVPDKPAG